METGKVIGQWLDFCFHIVFAIVPSPSYANCGIARRKGFAQAPYQTPWQGKLYCNSQNTRGEPRH
eukprot:5285184-Amphidinium_carterae.1